MIGILEAEREEKKRAKYLEKLRQQNKNPADEEKKKLEFISRFCSKVKIFKTVPFLIIFANFYEKFEVFESWKMNQYAL